MAAMQLTKYLALPREITPFEHSYVSRLNRIALAFFYLHIPVFMGLAAVTGQGPATALALSLFVVVGPTIAWRTLPNPRHVSVVHGITAMLMGGLLVHFGQGPVQIEMHFYFFALLAMLCMFANPAVNIAAAVTVALHHLVIWLIVPTSVFNYDAQWWVVLVHAAFVVLETAACCFISRSFFDNVIGLEKIVEARTETIREKQRDMRLILDNVDNGLITIDALGRMSGECSQAFTRWFGVPAAGEKLSTWLASRDPSYAEWLDLGLETLAEDLLPPVVAMAQLPRMLRIEDRTYSVQYQAIADAQGATEQLLVLIADITERLRSEAAGSYQAELLAMFQQIMRDRKGFSEFLSEAEEIVGTLRNDPGDDPERYLRLVHTLKGNAGIFGLRLLAERCNELEAHVADEGRLPEGGEADGLFQAWDKVRSDVCSLIGEVRQGGIDVDEADYEAALDALAAGIDRSEVLRMLESWRLEPAAKRLTRIEQQIRGIAERMGKDNVVVETEPNGLRFDPEGFGPFWSAFVHILRNAVDHGTEPRDVRRRQGKPEACTIRVSTTLEGGAFVVAVEDDGPGVDWGALRLKAASLGMGVPEGEAVEQIIFLPGVTSRATVDEYSGRGVGMDAVREAVRQLGGAIQISAGRDGRGSRFRFVFPGTRAYAR